MKRATRNKLLLRGEAIRILASADLASVNGGEPNETTGQASNRSTCHTKKICTVSDNCTNTCTCGTSAD